MPIEPAASVRAILNDRRGTSLITLDPNIRPDILGDRSTVLEDFESTARLADVLKLSDEDAVWLYPDLSNNSAIDHLLDPGAKAGRLDVD